MTKMTTMAAVLLLSLAHGASAAGDCERPSSSAFDAWKWHTVCRVSREVRSFLSANPTFSAVIGEDIEKTYLVDSQRWVEARRGEYDKKLVKERPAFVRTVLSDSLARVRRELAGRLAAAKGAVNEFDRKADETRKGLEAVAKDDAGASASAAPTKEPATAATSADKAPVDAAAPAASAAAPATAKPEAAAASGAPVVAPNPLDSIIDAEARKQGIDPAVVRGVVMAKSGGRADVKGVGAVGLMGVSPAVAARLGVSEADLLKPEVNVQVGTKLLKDALKRNSADWRSPTDVELHLALADYQRGPGATLGSRDVRDFVSRFERHYAKADRLPVAPPAPTLASRAAEAPAAVAGLPKVVTSFPAAVRDRISDYWTGLSVGERNTGRDVDVRVLAAIGGIESSFAPANSNVVGDKHLARTAHGPFQFQDRTARQYGVTAEQLSGQKAFDVAVQHASWLEAGLKKELGTSYRPEYVALAWNRGLSGAVRFIKNALRTGVDINDAYLRKFWYYYERIPAAGVSAVTGK